jgi:hypothetical protein
MYILLFDRADRLGANITNYITQILCAHKKQYFIRFKNNDKTIYQYYGSIFIKILFDYIDHYNQELSNLYIDDENRYIIEKEGDFIPNISGSLKLIEKDAISYFQEMIFKQLSTEYLAMTFPEIPFDPEKTIMVHLRLDDTSNQPDYDGSICSQYYRERINQDKPCEFYRDRNNGQHPLSKEKIETIIAKAKEKYPDYKVVLLTSPISDTSFLDYDVIKNQDENYDLYLLSLCKVVILSRSAFSISSLFFSDIECKRDLYIPLWGHFVCLGLDTKYEYIDRSKITYFY